ncbi:chemotaxis protein CheW [Temperatibacter marinus]|uniref:Chemotaxis protein CheA n=1 Tax=Temperatibacter marinus TaxID=1456591 RepID=A0AA52EG31_9PROT|nr:chemotaxis protein CheW [Temperatibacter marinus]WND01887.1 chemotaxis protein CheW [Temperatibacter marinus]
MDDLLNEFLTETSEAIDVVDVELVKLEQDPNNKEVLDNIFRLVHTIKGTCGFLGLPRLESVAHASENVLGKFRDGELEVTEHAVTVILESLDRIKDILAGLEETEEEPQGDDNDLIDRLDAIAEGSLASEPEADVIEADIVDQGLGRPLKAGEVTLEELEAAFASAPGPEAGGADDSAGDEMDMEAEMAAAMEEEQAADIVEANTSASEPLYDRVGGEDAIAVMAHLMSSRLPNDPKLSKFFKDSTVDQRKGRLSGIMTALFRDDLDSADNVARLMITMPGFDDKCFDALLVFMKSVMTECQVEADTRDEAIMSFELVREAVVSSSKAKAEAATAKTSGDTKRTSQSIRVSVDLLEDLMNMVSELVLTRNQLLQISRDMDNSELGVPLQRLSQCTTELQEGVMKTRMQPIGNAWAKLPRIVRDLTVELDKKIELEMRGAETELDRQVLELIKDPLTHMVRNSADHGVEMPAERLALGKPETGTIILDAYHEGGHIIVEIRDDGRGIPVEKLKGKILEKELATESELSEMSDNQIQKFIFHPGFSTAEKVTSVSGRGVGMDVVRSNIEKIGGTIDMVSIEGKGSTFEIKIPLTLAIVSALIVKADGERFAIPQISVLELVRASSDSEYRIEKIKDAPVLRLRNRLLPLVYLNEILDFSTREELEADEDKDDFIIVAQVGAYTFGIVVDQVFDTEEIVVKPVAPILKDIPIYSGNTILGDGSVIMILDPNGIAARSNAGASDQVEDKVEEDVVHKASSDENESMLVFRAGSENNKAVQLSLIARLEDIAIDEIEMSNGRHVVQYRGALMPIIKADPTMEFVSEGRQPVLVFTDREYTMGLAVDQIMDIVDDKLDIKLASDNESVVGSAVVDGNTTEIINVAYFLAQAFSDWLKSRDTEEDVAPAKDAHVLLIDDSDFFRSMVRPVLTVAGYKVTAVNGAQKALDLREDGIMFDLIVSDIEMPDMTGFEFAEAIKSSGIWQHTPLIALSSLASDKDINHGIEVGFDDYVAKFDQETLLRSLAQQLKLQGDAA